MSTILLHITAWIIILCICALVYAHFKNTPKGIMEFKTSMELSGLPVITFYQGNNKYNFLLDTGSSSSYLDSNSDMIRTEIPNVTADMIGIEGNRTECLVSVVDFYRDGMKYQCTMRVMDIGKTFAEIKNNYGINLSGILGNDFFVKYKYCLDFKNLVVYINK